MARTVIMGAGIAGHTAALHLRRMLPKEHEVVVVAPNSKWNWIPSNIWVGVGQMDTKQVTFPLAPIYKRKGIEFHQALATELHGDGSAELPRPHITVKYTSPQRQGETAHLEYDYLINATGPKLNFAATPGLGPDGNSWSVCTAGHAEQTAKALDESIAETQAGAAADLPDRDGPRHLHMPGCGLRVHVQRRGPAHPKEGVRDRAEVIYITNESSLGDFGMDGMNFGSKDGVGPESDVHRVAVRSAASRRSSPRHVERVEPGAVHYELLDGTKGEQRFDFAMLLPPFRGCGPHGLRRRR
jgi:sulfide:quinone oxidoreductase